MPDIFVTGASGFVGRTLCEELQMRGHRVIAAVRSGDACGRVASDECVVGDLAELPSLGRVLSKIDCLVHLAARVHVMRDKERDPNAAFLRSNAMATQHVAEQAAAAGVKRLIFLSSIKVQGEATTGRPFREYDLPNPLDPYGRSKLAAENALFKVASETGLEVVIIRPTIIYGPGVKANFRLLMNSIFRGVPLPLASVDNRRSLVSLWNLCDLIACCIDHAGAAGETFLVSDGRDLSTPELIRALGSSLDRRARLFPVAPSLLRILGRLLARENMVERLIGSLQVDITKVNRLLGWHPPLSSEEGIARTGRWYLDFRRAVDRC